MSANPEIYPYTDDPAKAVILCDKTLYQLTELQGKPLDSSIWVGGLNKPPSVNPFGCSFIGIGRHIEDSDVVIIPPLTDNVYFGLSNGTSGQRPNFGIAPSAIDVTTGIFSYNDLQNAKATFALNRWYSGNNTVNNANYGFKPFCKLLRGQVVCYLTFTVAPPLPESGKFSSFSAFSTWKNSIRTVSYKDYVETYRPDYPIILQATAVPQYTTTKNSNTRNNSGSFFYPQNQKVNNQIGIQFKDGNWNYYFDGDTTKPINGSTTVGSNKCGNYLATRALFNGFIVYGGNYDPLLSNRRNMTTWYCSYGISAFNVIKTSYNYTYQSGQVEYSYDLPAIIIASPYDAEFYLKLITDIGLAVGTTQNAANSGNIKTDPNIWTPTYNDNGDIVGNGNTEEDKTKYADGDEELNPNFDPMQTDGEYDPDEDIPEVDPDEDNETTDIFLPDVDLSSAGVFSRSYAVTKTELQNLCDYLWNPDPQTWEEILEDLRLVGDNRMNSIISLVMFPFVVPNDGTTVNIRIGRHNTTAEGVPIGAEMEIIDIGEFFLYPHFANFLDYEPYTTAQLYIPFVGVISIPNEQCMNKYISVKLAVDIITGAGQIVIYARSMYDDVGIPIIYKNCVIGMQISVTGADSAYTIRNYINGIQDTMRGVSQGLSGNVSGISDIINGQLSFISAQGAPVESRGSNSPECGLFMPNKCYFIVQRPKVLNVPYYGRLVGYSCYKSGLVGDFSGFSQFENAKLDITNANDYEKNEIIKLLRNGIYL